MLISCIKLDHVLYLINYSIRIFLAPSYIVTRSMPVGSIFRLKRMPPTPIPQLAMTTVGGLQMRSTTAEVIKENLNSFVKNLCP